MIVDVQRCTNCGQAIPHSAIPYCDTCNVDRGEAETEDREMTVTERLEYLRGEIRAERISWGELAELQDLADSIDPGDVELLEWAGVPEYEDAVTSHNRTTEDEDHVCPKIFHVWRERLVEGDMISRGLIRQWCSHIAAGSMGLIMGGWDSNLDPEHAAVLMDIFNREVATRDVYRLEERHNQFGLDWIRKNHAKLADYFNLPDDYLSPDQIDTADPFRFIGVHVATSNGFAAHINPVYQVRYYVQSKGLRTFSYHWSPYQRKVYGY